jgi:hypothetical protein
LQETVKTNQKNDKKVIAAFLFLYGSEIEIPPGMDDPEWLNKNIVIINRLTELYERVTKIAQKIINKY